MRQWALSGAILAGTVGLYVLLSLCGRGTPTLTSAMVPSVVPSGDAVVTLSAPALL